MNWKRPLALSLAALGLWVLRQSGNFTLLLCAAWLLWRRFAAWRGLEP